MENILKVVLTLALVALVGCSTEGLVAKQDGGSTGLVRGGENPNIPLDSGTNTDTERQAPTDTLRQSDVLGADSLGKQPDTLTLEDTLNDSDTKVINLCFESPGDGYFKEAYIDMSGGQCNDVPLYGVDGKTVIFSCSAMKLGGHCDNSRFSRCGLCKVSCNRC